MGACAKKGFCVIFSEQSVILKKDNTMQAFDRKQTNDIYRLFFKVIVSDHDSGNEANVTATSLQMWHERLGHINTKQLKRMAVKQCKTSK